MSAVFAASAPAAPVPAKTEKKTPPTKNEPVNQGGGANTTPPIVANNGVIALRTEKATLGLPLFLLRAGSGFTVLDVKLTATATANPQLASGEINCRAFPGPDGVRAAAFVKQQLFKRHNAWLRGTQIDIACAEKIPGGDLPAAAVTEALLVDAMILGYDLEPNFVALGDFDSDGGLIPTLATGTRVLAALRGGAVRITVPEKSTPQVADVMLAEGPAKFASVQIFAVSGFDEIPPLAAAQLDTKVQRAMSIFGRAQVLLNDAGDRADAALTDPRVKEALREVLIEAPNHLTARLLLGHGAGQFKTYSLAGSIETIEQRAPNIVRAARCTVPSVVAGIPADRPADELAKLKALREKLDDRAVPWLDALIRYGTAVNNWHANPAHTVMQNSQLSMELNSTSRLVQTEWPKLVALRDTPKEVGGR